MGVVVVEGEEEVVVGELSILPYFWIQKEEGEGVGVASKTHFDNSYLTYLRVVEVGEVVASLSHFDSSYLMVVEVEVGVVEEVIDLRLNSHHNWLEKQQKYSMGPVLNYYSWPIN